MTTESGEPGEETPIAKRILLGDPLTSEKLDDQLLPKRMALPIFASDALSSVAYAPQELLMILLLGGTAFLAFSPWVAAPVPCSATTAAAAPCRSMASSPTSTRRMPRRLMEACPLGIHRRSLSATLRKDVAMTALPAPVQALVDAINDADTDAFVAGFTEDGVVDDWGRVLPGHDGVRSWADSDAIGQGAQMTVLSADTRGNVTELRFEWTSRRFTGTSSAFVTVRDGLVSSFRIPPH